MNRLKIVLLWILLLTSDTLAQLLFKVAALNFKAGIWLANHSFYMAYLFEIISFLTWINIIKYNRLSVSLALTSMLYIIIAICSNLFFQEQISLNTWLGICVITLGSCILGIQEGKKADDLDKK